MLENSDNTETEETETLKRGMLEETDNSDNGKVDSSGENSLVLSYGDDEISCNLEPHSGLESGNDFNGKGQIEGGTDKSDGSENKFAMDKQDGREGVVNGQIHESVSSGDNGQDTDFAMDKNEGSEPTEMDRYRKVFLVEITDKILTLPWIKKREVNLRKMDRYRKCFWW